MSKKIALVALSALVLGAPALARDFNLDYGRNENRYAPEHRGRGGAHPRQWHGGKWRGHEHFSPRGQGGHHWGW